MTTRPRKNPQPTVRVYKDVKAEIEAAEDAILEAYADELLGLKDKGWSLRKIAAEIGTSYELVRSVIALKKKEESPIIHTLS
jgi:hypothetical protein